MDKFVYERICAITLNRIFGFEPKIPLQLIQNLGSASAVFSMPQQDLRRVFGMFSKYLPLISKEQIDISEKEDEWLSKSGYRFLCYWEPEYPALLKECEDPPIGLYVRSSSPLDQVFTDRPAISIVGTRNMTPYGRLWCRNIVDTISQAPSKPVIISGLAFGVDVTAHEAALECGIPTIAVLPTGLDDIYPSAHRRIAQRIADTPGCALITDYPPRTGPQKLNFLRRNRIIAALGSSTILIESKIHGGGMMTAGLANGYGRSVFALPGRIDDVCSAGCNQLLWLKQAEPIVSLGSLPKDLGLGEYSLRRIADLKEIIRGKFEGNGELQNILDIAVIIKRNPGICLDEICGALGLPYSLVSRCAGLLEVKGIIHMDLMQQCSIIVKNA